MRQLQFFTSAQLAKMRDRTAARNYSPERDAFRREHEIHRSWGLAQRHAERLRRIRDGTISADTVSRAAGDQKAPAQEAEPRSPSLSRVELERVPLYQPAPTSDSAALTPVSFQTPTPFFLSPREDGDQAPRSRQRDVSERRGPRQRESRGTTPSARQRPGRG